jgi:hypothetical protein
VARPSLRSAVRDVPGVARVVVGATVETATSYVRIGVIVARDTVSGRPPSVLVEDVANEATALARKLLEMSDGVGVEIVPAERSQPPARRESSAVTATVVSQPVPGAPWLRVERADRRTLHQMYDALIEESNDVHHHEENHPAYVRVMQDLTPDEARILRLLAVNGPQPSLDVRTAGTFGFGSTLVKPGVTMIGAHAGCQEPDRVPSYLNNLHRLGLVWFSREMIGDVNSYALLEAQPDVMAAAEELGGKNKIRNTLRSIELTAFGRNLCSLCGLLPSGELQTRASDGEITQRLPAPDER